MGDMVAYRSDSSVEEGGHHSVLGEVKVMGKMGWRSCCTSGMPRVWRCVLKHKQGEGRHYQVCNIKIVDDDQDSALAEIIFPT